MLTGASRDGSASWNGDSYTVRFTGPGAYDILDGGGATVGSGTYAEGDDIVFQGLRVRMTGVPAAGDEFTVGVGPRVPACLFRSRKGNRPFRGADAAHP